MTQVDQCSSWNGGITPLECLAHCSRAYHASMERQIFSLNTFLETSLCLLNDSVVILHDFLLLLFHLIDCHIIQLYIIVCLGFHFPFMCADNEPESECARILTDMCL